MTKKDIDMLEAFSKHSSNFGTSEFKRYEKGDGKMSDLVLSIIDGPIVGVAKND